MSKTIAVFFVFSLVALAAPSAAELEKIEWVKQPVISTAQYLAGYQAQHAKKPMPDYMRPPMKDSEVNWDAELILNQDVGFKSVMAVMHDSSDEFLLNRFLNFYLVDFDASGKVVGSGDSIVSWETSTDLTLDRIVLRDDLQWSDGKPFTADDVVFSLSVIRNDNTPIPIARQLVEPIKEIVALDARTLLFVHKEKLASNRMALWMPFVPKHVFEKSIVEDPKLIEHPNHLAFELNPVVCGPYKIVKRERGGELLIERREGWYLHGGKQVRFEPYFKKIRFRKVHDDTAMLVYRAGDMNLKELTPSEFDQYKKDAAFKEKNYIFKTTESGFSYFGWNNADPVFKDARVRHAMALTMDYEELLKILGYGENSPAAGIYAKSMWRGEKIRSVPKKMDLDKAEELLAKAGWVDSNDNGIRDKKIDGKLRELEFTMLTTTHKLNIDIGTLFKQSADQIGVKVNVKSLDPGTMFERVREKAYEAFFAGWGWDPSYQTDASIFMSGSNDYNYSSKVVDALFEEARREPDFEKQKLIFAKINDQIFADQPITPIWHRIPRYAIKKYIAGFHSVMGSPWGFAPGPFALWAKKN